MSKLEGLKNFLNYFFYHHRILKYIFFLVIGIIFVIIFYNTLLIIFYPFNITYGEGIILYQARDLIAKGFDFNSIYPNFTILPYNVNSYTPIYILLIGFITKITSLQGFLVGRLLSFISFLLSGLVIFKISNLFFNNKNRFLSSCISLTFLVSFLSFSKFLVVHVDMLGFLFYLVGIYLFFKYFFNKKDLFLYFSAIFFVFAFYTKQTYLIFPIFVILYLFFSNNKNFIKFLLLFLGLNIFSFLFINSITDGNFFLHTFFQNAIHQFSFKKIYLNWAKFLIFKTEIIFIFFIIFFNYLFHFSYKQFFNIKRNKIIRNFIVFYVLAVYLFVLITTGKAGADINYFFEIVFVNIFLLILSFRFLFKRKRMDKKLFLAYKIQTNIVKIVLILICLVVSINYFFEISEYRKYLYNSLSDRIFLINKIDEGDYYYSDDPTFLTNTNKALPISIDPFIFTQLYRKGWLDFFEIEKMIKNRKLKNIILSKKLDDFSKNNFYEKEMKYLFDKYYVFKGNILSKHIYELK